MNARDIEAITLAVIAALDARAATQPLVSAPAQATSAQPLAGVDTGKVCGRCGHEHARPVVSAQRARLATESACHIKGCVSRPSCA